VKILKEEQKNVPLFCLLTLIFPDAILWIIVGNVYFRYAERLGRLLLLKIKISKERYG
jgi:hypothetical protein